MKRFSLILILVTSISYSYYRYPELYNILGRYALEEIKQQVPAVPRRITATVNTCQNAWLSVVSLKDKAISIEKKVTSVDSLYAMVFPSEEPDTIPVANDEATLAGDIYDIQYDISYKGHYFRAHSRTLGKPRVGESQISYTLPTGQHYSLSLPDGEGRIILQSSEKVDS